jgi:hypothetical protein
MIDRIERAITLEGDLELATRAKLLEIADAPSTVRCLSSSVAPRASAAMGRSSSATSDATMWPILVRPDASSGRTRRVRVWYAYERSYPLQRIELFPTAKVRDSPHSTRPVHGSRSQRSKRRQDILGRGFSDSRFSRKRTLESRPPCETLGAPMSR